MFKDMCIGKKLGWGFGVLVGLLILVGIVAYFSFGKVGKQVVIVHDHADEIEMIEDLQRHFSNVGMPANDFHLMLMLSKDIFYF